jgi:predicted membrane channel-forming protein YqfA (hemolysin III family)
MSKKLRSPLVGFLCMLFIDSLARVIITIYQGTDFAPFSYVVYPDYWTYIMLGISVFGAFFGAMMVITLSGKKWVPFLIYIVVLALWRLSPLVLVPSEPQWIVITSAVLAVTAAFGSRQFIVDKKTGEKTEGKGEEVAD